MSKKSKQPPEVFSPCERFMYHLTELELVFNASAAEWTRATADAAGRRLEKLAVAVRRITARTKNE